MKNKIIATGVLVLVIMMSTGCIGNEAETETETGIGTTETEMETEISRFSDEYGSQFLNNKQFKKLVNYCLKDQYSFLFCCNTNPDRSRKYMKNFDEQLVIDKNVSFD